MTQVIEAATIRLDLSVMKKELKQVILNVSLIGVIGFAVGVSVFLHEWFKPKRSIVREKAAYVLSSSELASDFAMNASEAEEKYLNTVVEMSGTVTSKEVDTYENVNLIFSSDNAEIQVSFLGDFNEDAQLVEQGDHVTLKGNYTGYSVDDIFGTQVKLNNGYIIKEDS